mgnify:CR=1 FL=1
MARRGKAIWIPNALLDRLDAMKKHPRETYGDVIKRLIEEKRAK